MIKDSLLHDLALDWRRPYFKIKLYKHDQCYFGQFSLLHLKSANPKKAQFDAYNESDWLRYKTSRESVSYFFIDLSSHDIEEIEIIGFEHSESKKPKKFEEFKKRADLIALPYHPQDTLRNWDLKKAGIVKDEGILKYLTKSFKAK